MSKRIRVLFFVALFLIAAISGAFVNIITDRPLRAATSYYVSTSGNDSNPGTLDSPFKTIHRAYNASTISSNIYIEGGTYTPYTSLVMQKNGTVNDWFSVYPYSGQTVIINGSNCLTSDTSIHAIFMLKSVKYVRISGLIFEHSACGGVSLNYVATGVVCNNIRVDNCSIKNGSAWAFKAGGGSYIYCNDNYIYNNFNNWNSLQLSQETISFSKVNNGYIYGNYLWKNHCEQIDVKSGSSWCYVYNNTINTTASPVTKLGSYIYFGGIGIYIDSLGGTQHNISIYSNLIYGNHTAILVNNEAATYHYENISIYNNLINITNTTGGKHEGQGRVGIFLGREDGSTEINKDIKIYMNTVNLGLDVIHTPIQIGTLAQPMNKTYIRRLAIANNIFTNNNKTSGVYPYLSSGSAVIYGLNSTDGSTYIAFDNNLWNNSHSGATEKITWADGTFTKATSSKWGNNPLFIKPLYVSPNPVFDPHLNGTSPCLDSGFTGLISSVDYEGNTRPAKGGYDRGAFEMTNFTWYVSLSGSDTYPGVGTEEYPYATLRKAINASTEYDTICMRGGDYTQPGWSGAGYLRINKSHITIRNYTGEKVVIDGKLKTLTYSYGMIHLYWLSPVAFYHNITFYGLNFSNCSYSCIRAYASAGEGSNSNITFSHCDFYNITEHAIYVYSKENDPTIPCRYWDINNCTFTKIQNNASWNECITFMNVQNFIYDNNTLRDFTKQGLSLSAGTAYGIVKNNEFYNSYYFSLKLSGESAVDCTVHDIDIYNNYFSGYSKGTIAIERAITINSEQNNNLIQNVSIFNNIFNVSVATGQSSFPIHLLGAAGKIGQRLENISITYNTIYITGGNSNCKCIYITKGPAIVKDNVIANNILVTTQSGNQIFFADLTSSQTNFTLRNNSYYYTAGTPLGIWYTDESTVFETGAVVGNPYFVSIATGDFHINSTSPCFNAAYSGYTVSFDYDYIFRPQGTGYDIGAYEVYPVPSPPSELIETAKIISHGLSIAPTAVIVTATSYPGSFYYYYVDTITSTTFTLHLLSGEGVTVSFMWKAVYT